MVAAHNIQQLNIFWFRRDLRINDNQGLYNSLINGNTLCIFIWDNNILKAINKDNPRIAFIHQSLIELKKQLISFGSDLLILNGTPEEIFIELINSYPIINVYANEDYEPFAINRDKQVAKLLQSHGISLNLFKDHLIYAKREILNNQGNPYTVYTPYKNAWRAKLNPSSITSVDLTPYLNNFFKLNPQTNFYDPSSEFPRVNELKGGEAAARLRLTRFIERIDTYNLSRDIPSLDSTSQLGVDLRFGTISIRTLVQLALSRQTEGAETWLHELIWREFFSQIMYNFPHVATKPFRKEYEALNYQNNQAWFKAWCDGKTGYPIVDAGMRQLNQTGFMHNRVRMICASFLCKDLLIDWRLGERYFAAKLLDYDFASNNGNWQWCASTGCDAQPYFRIFNPYLQSQKFDPEGSYIRKFVPELANLNAKQIHSPLHDGLFSQINYPLPIVNHQTQTKLAKIMFAEVKQGRQDELIESTIN